MINPRFFPTKISADHFTNDSLAFRKLIQRPDIGFFSYTQSEQWKKDLDACQRVYHQFQQKEQFVHVGMGGSILGPQMVHSALGATEREFFFWGNVDATATALLFRKLSVSKTLFYIVSKSGNTIETLSHFITITRWLASHGVTADDWKDYFVFCTDAPQGELTQISEKYSIPRLSLPSNVGGRFSVLTAVGLFPFLFANINCSELFAGCRLMQENILQANFSENALFQLHSFILALKQQQLTQTVLMPYSSQLKDFTAWFAQLWAESLGKQKGQSSEGLTPIAAYGPSDQHSQLQLFLSGPKDKAIIFLEILETEHDFLMENSLDFPLCRKLKNMSLHSLSRAELSSTQFAFRSVNRPYASLSIPTLNEKSLGALILFFESLTALTGLSLGINPFDQPAVEIGKKHLLKTLSESYT